MKYDYSDYNKGYTKGYFRASSEISVAALIIGAILTLGSLIFDHDRIPTLWWVGMAFYGISMAISFKGLIRSLIDTRKIEKDLKILDEATHDELVKLSKIIKGMTYDAKSKTIK